MSRPLCCWLMWCWFHTDFQNCKRKNEKVQLRKKKRLKIETFPLFCGETAAHQHTIDTLSFQIFIYESIFGELSRLQLIDTSPHLYYSRAYSTCPHGCLELSCWQIMKTCVQQKKKSDLNWKKSQRLLVSSEITCQLSLMCYQGGLQKIPALKVHLSEHCQVSAAVDKWSSILAFQITACWKQHLHRSKAVVPVFFLGLLSFSSLPRLFQHATWIRVVLSKRKKNDIH